MKRRRGRGAVRAALLIIASLAMQWAAPAQAHGAEGIATAVDGAAGLSAWRPSIGPGEIGSVRPAIGTGYAVGSGRVGSLASRSLRAVPGLDAVQVVAPTPSPRRDILWLSLSTDTRSWNDEDIVALDPVTGVYYWVFDGSDMGITTDVDAFDVLPSGHILMSFDVATVVLGLGTVYDSDIVEFEPYELGTNTTGTFSWFFDGSDVGLVDAVDDIDALAVLRDGSLVISLREAFSLPGLSGQDEDLIRFTGTSWGATTAGTWSMYMRGSDIGLSTTANEDVDGIWIDQAVTPNPEIYLSTLGSFSVPGVAGENEDIFVFRPSALGAPTGGSFSTRLYLDGSLFNLVSYDIDAFDIQR